MMFMSTKKRWMFILAATLILTFANAAAVFAAEAADASDMQTEASDKQSTPTIVAGTTAAEKAAKAAKAAAEAAQKQEVPVPESKVIEAGKASRTTDQEEQEAAASDTETTASTASVKSLGIFKTTGYCPCYQCSEGWGRHTCTGAIARSGHTIAVDPRVIPYGSQVIINGVQYTAEDRGGAVRGNHIDIFYDTHAQTRQHGMRNAEVFLVL